MSSTSNSDSEASKPVTEQEVNEDDEYFVITRLHRDDIKSLYGDHSPMQKIIDNLSYDDMTTIASKMADDYISQLYWSSLEIIFEALITPRI